MSIRLLAADDQEVLRGGLQALFRRSNDIKLVGVAEDGYDLLLRVKELAPDVVLTDIRMPSLDGVAATHTIHRWNTGIHVIGFSMFGDEALVQQMFDAGAVGYLLKEDTKETIVEAIKAVYRGERYLSPLLPQLWNKKRAEVGEAVVTYREKAVLILLCRQCATKTIAAELKMSARTVDGYRSDLLRKTGAANLAGLILYAVRHGWFRV